MTPTSATQQRSERPLTRPRFVRFVWMFRKRNSTELRRRINATRFPEKETVTDFSQGVQLAFIQALARYWATDYNWRQVRGETELLSPIHHRDRRAGHPLHSRPLET